MKTYNGHKNWNFWNVALWISNDEGLYNEALSHIENASSVRLAAARMLGVLNDMGIVKTPDGAKYTEANLRAAMRDL